jgi:hypothetical protein
MGVLYQLSYNGFSCDEKLLYLYKGKQLKDTIHQVFFKNKLLVFLSWDDISKHSLS